MASYRTKYKKHFGIDFSKDYEIHHIDLNHNNDDIDNLVLLPKKLHARYHFMLNNCTPTYGTTFVTLNAKIHGNAVQGTTYQLGCMESLIQVLNECNKWYDYKMYLEGLIPNIHNIELDV